MLKILILFFLSTVSCNRIHWFSGVLGKDKCLINSDCNDGYYCKFVDNTCVIEGTYLIKCGFCTGNGL